MRMQNAQEISKTNYDHKTPPNKSGVKNFDPRFHQCVRDLQK